MTAAAFSFRSVQTPANTYFGIDASTSQAVYTAGAVKYVIYMPSTTAISAMGWTGLPFRVLMYHHGNGSELVTNGVEEGLQAHETNSLGLKLGYGSQNNGSLQTPDQNWPTIIVFPQMTTVWSGSNGSAGARVKDAGLQQIEVILDDLVANFSIDLSRIYFTSVSAGNEYAYMYLYSRMRWPQRFKYDIAGWVGCATQINGAGFRQNLPEQPSNESTTTQLYPHVTSVFQKTKVPQWWFVSTADLTFPPANYNPPLNWLLQFEPPSPGTQLTTTGTAAVSLTRKGGQWFRVTEYSGAGAPVHTNVWDQAYGNGTNGGAVSVANEPFNWLMQQQFRRNRVLANSRLNLHFGARGLSCRV